MVEHKTLFYCHTSDWSLTHGQVCIIFCVFNIHIAYFDSSTSFFSRFSFIYLSYLTSVASTDTASIGECAGPECVVSIAEQQQPQQHTRVTVVTSASDPYWTRLQNFVGSVQYWEPDLQIKVYDLGLSSENSNQVKMWRNVEYRKFPFNQFPPHFRNLQNFAWKPAVMNLSLWTDRGAILYQDAGQEFRQPIGEVEKLIFDNGYFFVVQEGLTTKSKCCGNIGELCHQGFFLYFWGDYWKEHLISWNLIESCTTTKLCVLGAFRGTFLIALPI